MNAIRLFISSPSDVSDERQKAGKAIERLPGKYWSFVRLEDPKLPSAQQELAAALAQ